MEGHITSLRGNKFGFAPCHIEEMGSVCTSTIAKIL
jgi:hypothetical protein